MITLTFFVERDVVTSPFSATMSSEASAATSVVVSCSVEEHTVGSF